MHIHGIVMTAILEEVPPGSDNVEMIVSVQGVGPGQPRKIVLPMGLLVANPEIEPETIVGHAFQAEVEEIPPKRWVVREIGFGGNRVFAKKGGVNPQQSNNRRYNAM